MPEKNSHKQQMDNQGGYDIWSTFYDRYPNPTVAMDELYFSRFWSHHSGQVVLEIGCGTGRNTEKLLGFGNEVLGVDLSPGMLKVAREKLPTERLTLLEGNILELDLPFEHFDLAVSSLVVEHIQDLNLLFQRVGLVLKPGGEFYLSEIHPERASQGILAHFVVDVSEIHLTSFFHEDKAFVRSAEENGFEILAQETLRGTLELSAIQPKWAKHLNSPMLKV